MAHELLLIEDVEDLGRSGDLVRVRGGYARNFLLPRRKAVVATKQTLRLREKLQQERQQRAAEDRTAAEQLAERLTGQHFQVVVKVDPEGHMYGSVSTVDLVALLGEHGYVLEKRHILLPHAVRELGLHKINLKLNEGVTSHFELEVIAEEQQL